MSKYVFIVGLTRLFALLSETTTYKKSELMLMRRATASV